MLKRCSGISIPHLVNNLCLYWKLERIWKKRRWYRSFPVNFAEFLRIPFLQNTSGRLLLAPFICLDGKVNVIVEMRFGSRVRTSFQWDFHWFFPVVRLNSLFYFPRGVFRILWNIYGGALCKNSWQLKAINYFHNKFDSY